MKIVQINDSEWMIGESLDACVAGYVENYGDADGVDEPSELSDSELDGIISLDEGTGEIIKRTIREQLEIEIAAGGIFPRHFGSSDW